MTATNHALTGALIAVVVDQPLLAIPLALASHFVLDILPHFGVSKNPKVRNASKLFRRVTITDLLICGLIFLVAPLVYDNLGVSLIVLWACMFAAICPDLVWGYRLYREHREKRRIPKSLFSLFHSNIQWGERPWGLGVEVIWGVVVSIVIIAPIL